MIPVELRLTNFMSYKYMDEPLNFSSIHTAVLCGPNGHGKSSLLDAITWAIWGRARGVDKRGTGTDDLIHRREPNMQVEFTFDLEGQRYRIIRARQHKGKTGVSKLEFQILDGGNPRPLTGENINKTQEIINKTLRMDYETFVNSALVMQGRADNFMIKSANERKEILSEILGLSIYDELEELAKEKRKMLTDRLRDIDSHFIHIDQELAQLPAYKEDFKKATAELKAIQAEIKKDEKHLAKLKEEKAVYDMKTAHLAELNAKCTSIKEDIADIDGQLKALKESIHKARELVDKKDEINEAYRELKQLRKKEEDLSSASQKHGDLERQASKLKLVVEQAKSALESNINHLTQRKAELDRELSQKPKIEAALYDNRAKVKEFDKLEQELSAMRDRYSELQQKKASLDASIKAAEAKLDDLQKRRRMLTEGDSCPLCKRPLKEHDRGKLNAEFDSEISLLRTQIDKAKTEASSIEREIGQLTTKGKDLALAVKSKDKLKIEEGVFTEKIKAIDKATAESATISRQLSEQNLKLAQSLYAQDEQAKLSLLSAEIKKLGYSQDDHIRIKERLKELLDYEQLKANLENAQNNIKMAETTSKALAKKKEAKLKSLAEDEKRTDILSNEIVSLKDASEDIRIAGEKLTQKKEIETDSLNRKSAAQARIDNLNNLADKKAELSKERKGIAKEAEIYDKLAFSFSKKGIQALIIENTIPEIEEEANSLLRRLTDGQMSLRFIMQKDQKTGGVVETLDLIITDGELGDRKYELFSGGEAFRINFAVRIALSKLLARRAGARLETLVIDEGFGTQDEEGKERLIEAISAIQNDFKKIIVVTHLEDLKEIFPARIEVTKKRGVGSVATVI